MNKTTVNVLKILCVAGGAALSMLGNVMGNGKDKDDAKAEAEQK